MPLLELRLCVRRLRRAPGFAVAVIAILALGVGAITAAFSLASAAWLDPLPYPRARQLVSIWLTNPRYPDLYLGLDEKPARVAQELPALSEVVRYEAGQAVWRREGQDARMQAGTALVSPEFFRMLGLSAAQGRYFAPADFRNGNVAIAAPTLGAHLGAVLDCGGRAFTIVGIAPAALRFPSFGMPERPTSTEIWLPYTQANKSMLADSTFAQPSFLGRMRPGVNPAALRSQLEALTRHLPASTLPAGVDQYGRWSLMSLPLATEVAGAARAPLLMLWVATLVVWLIAVANTAHLLMQRAILRQEDLKLKIALGAGTWALAREALLEALVLALGGGGLGCVLAYGAVAALRAWAPVYWLPAAAGFNGVAAVFALVASAVAGVLAAWLPARAAMRRRNWKPLPRAHSGAQGSTLLIAELALAIVLLASAGLLLESFVHLARVQTGLDTTHVVAMSIRIPKKPGIDSRLMNRMSGLPGVTGVALSGAPLLQNVTFFEPPVRTGVITVSRWQHRAVTPDYFRVVGIPLLAGRTFTQADATGRVLAVIANRAFVREAWPDGTDPIGRGIRIPSLPTWVLRVVGVVADARDNGLTTPAAPELYTLLGAQSPQPAGALFVRTRGIPARSWPGWNRRIRQQVWSVVGDVPIASLQPVSTAIAAAQAGPRYRTIVLIALAVLGLVLGTAGAFAVFAYATARRAREIGIRMAIGARPRQISARLMLDSGRLVAAAAAIGAVAAWYATRLLRANLTGIHASTALALTAAVLILAAAALTACYLPARRAAQIDPAVILRQE